MYFPPKDTYFSPFQNAWGKIRKPLFSIRSKPLRSVAPSPAPVPVQQQDLYQQKHPLNARTGPIHGPVRALKTFLPATLVLRLHGEVLFILSKDLRFSFIIFVEVQVHCFNLSYGANIQLLRIHQLSAQRRKVGGLAQKQIGALPPPFQSEAAGFLPPQRDQAHLSGCTRVIRRSFGRGNRIGTSTIQVPNRPLLFEFRQVPMGG